MRWSFPFDFSPSASGLVCASLHYLALTLCPRSSSLLFREIDFLSNFFPAALLSSLPVLASIFRTNYFEYPLSFTKDQSCSLLTIRSFLFLFLSVFPVLPRFLLSLFPGVCFGWWWDKEGRKKENFLGAQSRAVRPQRNHPSGSKFWIINHLDIPQLFFWAQLRKVVVGPIRLRRLLFIQAWTEVKKNKLLFVAMIVFVLALDKPDGC